jgi:DNA-binding NarL/FixJ family response regulator
VQTVDSGEKALDLLRSETIDLVVLDMVFETGMNGVDTYAAVKEINPSQKALVTSGFFGRDDQARISSLGVTQYLHKPYSISAMGRAIHQVLHSL